MKLTPQEVENRIKSKASYISLDHSTYVNTTLKARFIDEKYGEWWAAPRCVLRGREHPNRKFKLTPEEVKNKVLEKFPFFILNCSNYINTHTKAEFFDTRYNESFLARPNDILNGHDCNAKYIRHKSPEYVENEIKETRPYISLDYSTFKNMMHKARFIDSDFGEFWDIPTTLLHFKKRRHPKGACNSLLTASEIEKRLQKIKPHVSLDHTTYTNTSTKAMFIDKKHGEWWATPNNVLEKNSEHPNTCPIGLEIEFSELTGFPRYNKVPLFLKEDIQARPDFKISEDIYVDVGGLFWHSEKKTDKWYHYKRRELFEKYGKKIIQYWGDEVKGKPQIICSMVNNHLGKNKILYARKCSFSHSVDKEFFEQNHLMGWAAAKVMGLVYKNEIVSALSYKIVRGELHIVRFCNKVFFSVVGAFSKLLKAIIKKESFRGKIINFVDLRYGTGTYLLNLGFSREKITLGWKWTDGNNTYNRLKCRANLDGRRLSEKQHAEELKWFHLYDAGQAKYIKIIGEARNHSEGMLGLV